ncbi:hypothetical protein ACU5AX_13310 [Sphingomonas sp. XXL09]|uniref:hypothetical protein n=1 Tax=Sphingomonas sp. XXL09 TaxID=3457787 RepID=UPI00406BC62C
MLDRLSMIGVENDGFAGNILVRTTQVEASEGEPHMGYWAMATLLLASAVPGSAQVSDPLAMTTDEGDRAVMAEVASAVSSRTPDLARLDVLLTKLPRPTPLRGMVQTVRAGVLANRQDAGPAVTAIEEALRLLPDDPRPKLVAAGIFTFSGSPQRAADLWIDASRLSPEFARMSDRYMIMALIGRLTDIGDRIRADRLSVRMAEIGFSTGLASERSNGALARTREAVRENQVDAAMLSVTAISDPLHLLTLYVDQRYAVLWPRIAEWAGSDLTAQSRRYLEELRADWQAGNSFETAVPYARRLSSLQAHSVIIALFLPMFDRVRPGGEQQEEAEFLAPVVARALALQGRQAEARALLAKVAAAMPANDQGNALNIDGAYLTLASAQADWPDVMRRADAFLARAKTLGPSVNKSASLQVQAWRACALHHLGQEGEAQRAMADVALAEALLPEPAMNLYICRGEAGRARALVLSRLADPLTRDWALRFVQPTAPDIVLTPLDRLMKPVSQAVRDTPEVIVATKKVGRILPGPVNASIPIGFDPFRARPTDKPLGPGSV